MKQRIKVNKKGISPLIATVLLIGFAVALAAVVMTWGLDFIRSTTDNVGKRTDEALKCATKLDFEITDVDCASNTVTVANNGDVNISSMTFRVYRGGDVDPVKEAGIGPLGIKQYTVDVSSSSKIEGLASVTGESGQEILCKDASEEYTTNCA